MRAAVVVSLCLTVLMLNCVNVCNSRTSSLNKLTYTRWINLLRYVHKTLQREPPTEHNPHLDRDTQVDAISTAIVKYFFNDIFKPIVTDHGIDGTLERFPVDFLIMLDSSASVGSEHFTKALKMLTTWVSVFDDHVFNNNTLRISMITFSEPDKIVHEFPFSSGLNKDAVIDRINSTDYHAGKSTSTAQALWLADSIFNRYARPNVTRFMLLATDGWSHNELQLPFGVLWPAARLKKLHGVKVFVVGIGNTINHNELKAIASKPVEDHLFEVADYAMMLEVLEKVQEQVGSSEDDYFF